MMRRTLVFAGIAALMSLNVAARQELAEATSLLGRPLYPAPPSAEARKQLEENLAVAEAAYRKAPDNADAIIWFGRRTAYLGRYGEAIGLFTRGIEKHPSDARMYRHRGHRYISIRKFDEAIADLSKAAELVKGKPDEVEPDGQPNARNTPTSTLNSNIYYHHGLAHYLAGRFDKAADAYRECLKYSKNPDMLSATTHWQYMTLRRLGRTAEANALLAAIAADMDIIENGSYHRLLMMYKDSSTRDGALGAGATTAESLPGSAPGLDAVTIGYGVANWHLYNGRRDRAIALLREIVEKNATQWPAFGYIAAEADLVRLTR
jgi:tetratricopeptide (TPR) repeat protein